MSPALGRSGQGKGDRGECRFRGSVAEQRREGGVLWIRRQPHPSPRTPAAMISLSSEQGRVGDVTLCWRGGERRVECEWRLTEGTGLGRGLYTTAWDRCCVHGLRQDWASAVVL
jgi:hypothetical protein